MSDAICRQSGLLAPPPETLTCSISPRPALCINAADDPFLPRAALECAIETASEAVEIRVTPRGGHTGFIAGALPWRCAYWAEESMVRWLLERGPLVRSRPTFGRSTLGA